MLVELGLVEQRYQAVLEVLEVLNDGATVTDVARRAGVGGSQLEAVVVSASDAARGRGPDCGDAP